MQPRAKGGVVATRVSRGDGAGGEGRRRTRRPSRNAILHAEQVRRQERAAATCPGDTGERKPARWAGGGETVRQEGKSHLVLESSSREMEMARAAAGSTGAGGYGCCSPVSRRVVGARPIPMHR